MIPDILALFIPVFGVLLLNNMAIRSLNDKIDRLQKSIDSLTLNRLEEFNQKQDCSCETK